MSTICDDILFKIIEYIPDNKTCINLVKSCIYFKKILYKHGYLKSIKLDPLINNDPYIFSERCWKHRKTLNCVSIYGFTDPHLYMTVWPKRVVLSRCKFTKELKPLSNADTTHLSLYNDQSQCFDIAWEKFPNIKKLDIHEKKYMCECIRNLIKKYPELIYIK